MLLTVPAVDVEYEDDIFLYDVSRTGHMLGFWGNLKTVDQLKIIVTEKRVMKNCRKIFIGSLVISCTTVVPSIAKTIEKRM